jgi:elongation factor Ts
VTDIAAKDVQRLRQQAGVGMMDAKKALEDAGGDYDRAFTLLRERGQAKVAKRAEREAAEGAIGSYLHVQNERPTIGVLVELACETDFVAKSDEFKQVANDLAMHVSWSNPEWITREEVDSDALAKERELIVRQASVDGKPPEVVERIVEGKLEAWYAENVLYDQRFVNAEKFDGTVADMVTALASKMGENISVRRIARMAVGG